MVYRIPEARPHLKGGGTVDVSEQKPALAYDSNSDIIMFAQESWLTITASWLKSALMFILSALLIFTVMYGTLAASLFFVTSVDSKVTAVARDTFLGGIPAKNDMVLTSPTQVAGDNPLDRLREAVLGVKDAQIVEILSGPSDKISMSGDSFTVTGQEPGFFHGAIISSDGKRITKNFQLGDQYLTSCVGGACKPNTFLIVEEENLYGEVVNLKEMR